jgi:hypothetical protein
MDGAFSLIHFYHLIIKTLSDSTDQWVVDTLKWWNRFLPILPLISQSGLTLSSHRKIFGDEVSATAKPKARLRITAQTAYRLMRQQAASAANQEAQVCICQLPRRMDPLTRYSRALPSSIPTPDGLSVAYHSSLMATPFLYVTLICTLLNAESGNPEQQSRKPSGSQWESRPTCSRGGGGGGPTAV